YEWLVPLDYEELLPVEALTGFLPEAEKALEQGFNLETGTPNETKAQCLGTTRSLRAMIEAAEWAAVARSTELAVAFSRLFNLPPVGKHFRCLLPGCEGASTEHAVLWHSPQGIKYRCFSKEHRSEEQHGRPLS